MPSSSPWWENPPFVASALERRYRRRSRHHDYQRSNRRYMITISASPMLPPLSQVLGSVSQGAEVKLSPIGECFLEALKDWLDYYKAYISLDNQVIMPDHVHFCFSTNAPLKTAFSTMMSVLMGKATMRLRTLLVTRREWYDKLMETSMMRLRKYDEQEWRKVMASGPVPVPIEAVKFFSRGFTDSIALTEKRWKDAKRYVADNPRRLLFKRMFPEYLRHRWQITVGEKTFIAVGNVMLLKNPHKEIVRYSSKYTREQLLANCRNWEECIRDGGVLVSPFINPNENAARKNAVENGGLVIKICDNGFPEKFSPGREDFDMISEKRLLLITDRPYTMGKKEIRRETALELNKLAVLLAETDFLAPDAARIRRL
ncbi:MAG: hypothetical protein HDS71_03535 [Bacteroidales bacterium]|nr:hypothetical protein [Bacteroidales bacterium]